MALLRELSQAAGTVEGMIGGQVADLEAEGKPVEEQHLHYIHRAKTGAMIRASVRMGAIYCGAPPQEFEALSQYGRHIGLAFQIVDDILDVEGTPESLGKTPGKDAQQQKATFPALYGIEESRRQAARHLEAAKAALEPFGERAPGCTSWPAHCGSIGVDRLWRWRFGNADCGDKRAPFSMKASQRIDLLLLERGLADSREKAQAMILAGEVLADEQKVDKPGHRVRPDAAIRLLGQAPKFVSRGGRKLEAALDRFGIDVTGKVCADIGASTGGFTDCLLQRGARKVYAVDVGARPVALEHPAGRARRGQGTHQRPLSDARNPARAPRVRLL